MLDGGIMQAASGHAWHNHWATHAQFVLDQSAHGQLAGPWEIFSPQLPGRGPQKVENHSNKIC